MGFFDAVKDKAGALAADAGRAGKVTAAQARLAVLQNDLRKAERVLGHEAFALIERGELDHPGLAGAVARVRATTAEVDAKEAEITSLRGAGAGAGAEEAVAPAAETVEAVPAPGPAFGAGPEVAVADESSPPVVVDQAAAEAPVEEPAQETPVQPSAAKKAAARKTPAKKPADTKAGPTKTAAKKAPAKKPAVRRAPAKKPAATSPGTQATPRRGTAKGGTGGTAGATPKKSGRPSSSRSRPAGKKKPAGA